MKSILINACLLLCLSACGKDAQNVIANAGPDQIVESGQAFQLNGLQSSSVGGLVSNFHWSQTQGETLSFSDPSLAAPTLLAPSVTAEHELHFLLEIKNDSGDTHTDNVVITVVPVSGLITESKQQTKISGGGSYPVETEVELRLVGLPNTGEAIDYQWKQLSGKPVDYFIKGASTALTLTTPLIEQDEAIIFQASWTDASGQLNELTANIVVLSPDFPTFTVTGTVLSVAGEPLSETEVRVMEDGSAIGELFVTSDDGKFSFELEQGFDYVLGFSKSEYIEQIIPVLEQSTEKTNQITSVMYSPAPTIETSEEGEIRLAGQNGVEVSFDRSLFVSDAEEEISGILELSMTSIDTTDDDGNQPYFGLFAGYMYDVLDTVMISNLGMAKFTFSVDGEPVDIAFGEAIEVTIPIYTESLQDGSTLNLGDEVPLWSYSQRNGTWEQEGDGIIEESPESPTGLVMRAELTQLSW